MKNKLKGFLIGVVFITMLSSVSILAIGTSKTINVILNSVYVKVNSSNLPSDNILYAGNIYVRADKISSALNKDFKWDKKANIINIQDKTIVTTTPKPSKGSFSTPTPTPIESKFNQSIIEKYKNKISGSSYMSMAVKEDGSLWTWGNGYEGGIGNNYKKNPERFVGISDCKSVSVGFSHALILKDDGSVWAWGNNYRGQLGNGNSGSNSNSDSFVKISGLDEIVSISARMHSSMALKNDGSVWTWGYNANGQLGIGSHDDQVTPNNVVLDKKAIKISAGDYYSIVLLENGTVWAWGINDKGQLGDGGQTERTRPAKVSGLSDIIDIATGETHSLALKRDGTVFAWGSNALGQCGEGTSSGDGSEINKLKPVRVKNLTNIISVGCGRSYSAALRSDGSVWGWGYNDVNQIGPKASFNQRIPIKIDDLDNIISLGTGDSYLLALKTDGTIWGTGLNEEAELGDGTTQNRTAPIQIKNFRLFENLIN